VGEINSRLEAIAFPATPRHHHHHTHHHEHALHSPSTKNTCHKEKEKEEPHFHELRLKWENVRDGIVQTMVQFWYRLGVKAPATKDAERGEGEQQAEHKETDDEVKKKLAEGEKHDATKPAEAEEPSAGGAENTKNAEEDGNKKPA